MLRAGGCGMTKDDRHAILQHVQYRRSRRPTFVRRHTNRTGQFSAKRRSKEEAGGQSFENDSRPDPGFAQISIVAAIPPRQTGPGRSLDMRGWRAPYSLRSKYGVFTEY